MAADQRRLGALPSLLLDCVHANLLLKLERFALSVRTEIEAAAGPSPIVMLLIFGHAGLTACCRTTKPRLQSVFRKLKTGKPILSRNDRGPPRIAESAIGTMNLSCSASGVSEGMSA